MKRILFVLIVLTISFSSSLAQRKQGNVPPIWHRMKAERHVVDTTSLIVYYAFNAKDVHDESTYVEKHWLQIGKRMAKYSSYYLAKNDSLGDVWLKAHPKAQSGPHDFLKQKNWDDSWSEFTNDDLFIQDGQLTEYALFPMGLLRYSCYYTEPYPAQMWQLTSDVSEVCGYKCQKAVCRWRGRDYTAWFTMDIPVRMGPWKFGGLPGLILKLTESKGEYSFECIQIEKRKRCITSINYSKFKKMDRDYVLSLQKRINVNWQKASGAIPVNSDGSPSEAALPADIPYSPLELE